jgi:murein DD-endopeptidase MepM/ murein hydrolase activator NlpD
MGKIAAVLAGAGLLVGPVAPLLGVAVLMNPAAKGDCLFAEGLTVTNIPDSLDVTLADGATVTLGRGQLGHAATIVTEGFRVEGADRDAVVVALIAAATESGLRMLSNTAAYPESADYPNDGDGADHDSLGLFQMRPSTGWGEVAQLMDPVHQVRAFMGGPTGPNHPSPSGLLDIPGWEAMGKDQAAQAVEASAHPDRYHNWEGTAETVLAALTDPARTGGTLPGGGGVVFPLPDGAWVKTSGFGWRTHPISGDRRFHAGTDYSAPDGAPILAVAAGRVTSAGPMGGYGNAIIITHTIDGQAVASLYGHMWDGHLYVKAGDMVAAGQHVGDVGSAGQSTGPHLHLEIRPDGDPALVVDPDQWLTEHHAQGLAQPSAGATGCRR